jgi:hypothetical protein
LFVFVDGFYHRLARFDAEKGSIEWLGGEESDGSRCWNYRYNYSSSRIYFLILEFLLFFFFR